MSKSGILKSLAAALVATAFAGTAAAQELRLDPDKVRGPESCAECHKKEFEVWKTTRHAKTEAEMHRTPEAKAIADKLGIKRIKSESSCISCHYTMKGKGDDLEPIAGISCESCHGASAGWIDLHSENASRAEEPADKRKGRFEKAAAAGMIRPVLVPEKLAGSASTDLYSIAENCYQCHTVPNEELVNKGGHAAGSQDFELVSWSQGEVRHNLWYTDDNHEAPAEHKRLLFVMGKLLDLEYSLRGVAEATEKGDYAVTMAKRANTRIKELEAIQGMVAIPEVAEAIAAAKPAKLSLNNKDELLKAAGAVQAAAKKFNGADGSKLAALDKVIPTKFRSSGK